MKIFIIGPVRNASEEVARTLAAHVFTLEEQGHSVHLPARDTPQIGDGAAICHKNRLAIYQSDEIHIYWTGSEGQLFDFGMAYAMHKPIVLINEQDVTQTATKSFANVLRHLHFYWQTRKPPIAGAI